MGRAPRVDVGGMVYHVLNRAAGERELFAREADYRRFEEAIAETLERRPMRILAYCLMPNHWHLVLWPEADGQLAAFVRSLTLKHTQCRHAYQGSVGSGPLYQGRYKSFPIQDDAHLFAVMRYVERNALRAGLAARAEAWAHGSLWRRRHGRLDLPFPLSPGPLPLPADWVASVNAAESAGELEALRLSLKRGRPYGGAGWVASTAARLGLEASLRPRGRPPAEKVSEKGEKVSGGKGV